MNNMSSHMTGLSNQNNVTAHAPAARLIGAHKSTSILNSYEHFQTILMLLNLTNNPLQKYFVVTFCNLPDFFQFLKLFIP